MEQDNRGIPEHRKRLYEDLQKQSEKVDKTIQFVSFNEKQVPLFNKIELSIIDTCNRSCEFCPRSNPAIAPKQKLAMATTLFRKISEELKFLQFNGTLSLAGFCEPLLHPEILEAVQILSQHSVVEIYTNGDKITPELARNLADAGAAKIVVNMYDGPHQAEQFEEIFAKAGISGGFALRDRWYSAEDGYGMIVTNRAGTINIGSKEIRIENSPCCYPHYYLTVDWNGDVYLCPHDWNRRLKFGNVMFSSMLEIWCSTAFNGYRQHLAEGKRNFSPCNKCNADGTKCGRKHMEHWEMLRSRSA